MDLEKLINEKSREDAEAKPAIFNLALEEDQRRAADLIVQGKIQHVSDDYREELKELYQVKNPALAYAANFEERFHFYLAGLESKRPLWQEGRWAYYPWLSTLTHVLEESEFQAVRWARNRNLISEEEQKKFYDAVIGIAGLSVGNSAALAIVLGGGGRKIRLADSDRLALSNLNRIRSGVESLGLNKTVLTARQIYALNPYAEVESFSAGLAKENIGRFFDGPPRLDIVIDEIDNLAVKYLIREEARRRRLAVVMAADNGDNGVVDIERYDLDPATPFFHGRMGEVSYEKLAALDKFGIGRMITKHVGPENVTERMKNSLLEIGKTIVSWPQLGGAALLNGSAVAYCVRKIINGQPLEANRAIISLDEKLIPDYNSPSEREKRQKAAEEFRKVFGLEDDKGNNNGHAATPMTKRERRKALIDEIIKDLESLKSKGNLVNLYAVEENIKFFRATYSLPKFTRWLITDMRKVDGSRLLELSDFRLSGGKWERILQKELLEIEKWKFPDLLKHFREEILGQIKNLSGDRDHLVIADIGCGAMEIERQVINQLKKERFSRKIVFWGIDGSQESLDAARANLSELKVPIIQELTLNQSNLAEIKDGFAKEQYAVVLFKGHALELDRHFNEKTIDLAYHSKFKHHLPEEEKAKLDELLTRLSRVVVEYDNLNGWFMKFIPLRANWPKPVLLNGGYFSTLRVPRKKQLKNHESENWSAKTYPDCYLRIYKSLSKKEYPRDLPPDIVKIIEAGTRAPSGDNCQPWRFEIKNSKISLYNLPERDTSLYSWNKLSSYFAHGALIENMTIAGAELGYELRPSIFPDESNPDLVADIEIKRSAAQKKELFGAITLRVTNRKPYAKTPLAAEERRQLFDSAGDIPRGRIIIAEDRSAIENMAQAVSMNEKVLFENKAMHQFFFSHITWSEKEDREKGIGFYIKTLEIPDKAAKGFGILSSWPLAAILSKFGFADSIAKQNSKIYAASAAFAAVIMPSNSREDYLLAGRMGQMFWLTATNLGLSVQPLTGVLFLAERILAGEVNALDPKHVKIILGAYNKIRSSFGAANGAIAMLFRVGRGGEPSARSLRLVPEIANDHSLDGI